MGFSVALVLALALERGEVAAGAARRAFVGSGWRVGCDGVLGGCLGIDFDVGFGLDELAFWCCVFARVSLRGTVNPKASSPYET